MVAMKIVSTYTTMTSRFLEIASSESSFETVLPPNLRGTITRLLTKKRRNHHFTPSYTMMIRLTLTPPAALPIAPPINISMVTTASGMTAHACGLEF
jgi:hypothetical protein